MYLTAETMTMDEDEGRFTLEIVDDEGNRHSFIIQHIDLDAFYDQIKGRIGPYLRERDEARITRVVNTGAGMQVFMCDPDESGGYDRSDPKHPDFHSVRADIWDARAGK